MSISDYDWTNMKWEMRNVVDYGTSGLSVVQVTDVITVKMNGENIINFHRLMFSSFTIQSEPTYVFVDFPIYTNSDTSIEFKTDGSWLAEFGHTKIIYHGENEFSVYYKENPPFGIFMIGEIMRIFIKYHRMHATCN